MKTCSVCGERKPISEYHRNGKGHRGECKACASYKKWRRDNPEGAAAIRKKYYEKNKNDLAEFHRIRNRSKYQNFRKQILERDNHKSVLSGVREDRMFVHHIVPVGEDNLDLLYRESNCITVTAVEHNQIHKNKYGPEEMAFLLTVLSSRYGYEYKIPEPMDEAA